MDVTKRLAAYCADLTLDQLPNEVIERTRFLVLDLLGCIVRGQTEAAAAPSL